METESLEIKISGIVQGVGFRPFIYNLAKSLYLNGWVSNVNADVIIHVEGSHEALEDFVSKIKTLAPPISIIKSINVKKKPCTGYSDFIISASSKSEAKNIYYSPDISTCLDCQSELFDQENSRYLYPFINCTNCGPRFTITQDVPYDRVNTTMEKFHMCDSCAMEYNTPSNRRYHAQPISCYKCGPRLELLDNKGEKIACEDKFSLCRELLLDGKILAVKGLGGYHLVCDATNEFAVMKLRNKKIRDDKPFAIMARDYDTASKYCYISGSEKALLISEKKPIVLLKKRENCNLPEEIAPGNPYLGVMLPYTPVHLLLFSNRVSVLVMTSGNRSNEPIYYKDDEALSNLVEIADCFLTNDREIFIRTDDSVTRVFRNKEYILRRSRGYVPMPISFEAANMPCSILACGGELKSTFCINKGNEFFLSHHIGDLENSETLDSFEEGISHFKRIFNIEVSAIAFDLHPEYLSTKYALSQFIEKKVAVQHHHAHIASCMVDNNLDEDVIGVAFDGTGYGEDGNLWGGEFFTGGFKYFHRQGHLEYIKMPGGEAAIKEPWRMALSYLYKYDSRLNDETSSDFGKRIINKGLFTEIDFNKLNTVIQMIDKNINCPLTSSVGRLFDAVSAMLIKRERINYEGQAAIELEFLADVVYNGEYESKLYENNDVFTVSVKDLFMGILEDMKKEVSREIIASKFHTTIASMISKGCILLKEKTGLRKVVLSGGVFQNMILLEKTVSKLETQGFQVYTHNKIPSNDGGISIGQAIIAANSGL